MSTKVGTIAEQKFKLLCLERDIPIFEPILDYFGIDFVIKNENGLAMLQVKSTLGQDKGRAGSYKIGVRHGAASRAYKKDAFDFLIVHLFSVATWYIIPMKFLKSSTTIRINPDSEKCKYSKFKEAWHMLK